MTALRLVTDDRDFPACALCPQAITFVQVTTPGKVAELKDGRTAHVRCIERWFAHVERQGMDAMHGAGEWRGGAA